MHMWLYKATNMYARLHRLTIKAARLEQKPNIVVVLSAAMIV